MRRTGGEEGEEPAGRSQALLGGDPDIRPRLLLDDVFDLRVHLLQTGTLHDRSEELCKL